MARRGSWFFEGYEAELRTDAKGREKKVLVYRGEWYGLDMEPGAQRRCKAAVAVLTAVMTAVYLLVSFFPTPGGMSRWVGVPLLLALVPLMFLWIGLFNFLFAREKWEIRVYYAGYRRIKRSLPAMMAILAFSAVGEIVYMIRSAAFGAELLYLLGLCLCLLCAGGLLAIQRRCPAVIVQGPEVK